MPTIKYPRNSGESASNRNSQDTDSPKPAASPSRPMSGFVSCEGLTCRPADVDGFFHLPAPDPEAQPETIVFFKGYTIPVPDPDKKLHTFLTETTRPHVH